MFQKNLNLIYDCSFGSKVAEKNLSVRQFKPNDLNGVIHINRVCLPENYPPSFFLDLHRRFPETFLVAEKGEGVLGYVMCRIETGSSAFRPMGIIKKGHVISIAILPEYQHLGIGRALMNEVIRAMLEYEAKECYLEVRVTNSRAIDFYKKMGFKITQTLRGYYADGGDAYILIREIV